MPMDGTRDTFASGSESNEEVKIVIASGYDHLAGMLRIYTVCYVCAILLLRCIVYQTENL